MKYSHTVSWEPASYPGFKAILRRLSFGQRLELGEKLDALLHDLEKVALGQDVQTATGVLLMRVDEAHIRAGLVSWTGLEIEDIPEQHSLAKIDLLIRYGPSDLLDQMAAEIKRLSGVSEEERKNLPSGTTSPGTPDGTPGTNGSASIASVPGSSPSAIADGSSPRSTAPTTG